MARHESERLLGPDRIFLEPSDNTVLASGRDVSYRNFRKLNDQDRLELRLTRRFLLGVFEVDNLSEIQDIGKDRDKKERVRQNFVTQYCEMLGVKGDYDSRLAVVRSSLNDANSAMAVIEDSQIGLLRQLRGNIGTLNEVAIVNDPIDLLLMCFSGKASRRMRYEARRKLMLGDLAVRSSIENHDIEQRLDSFSRFLGKSIWASEATAKVEPVELLSYHSPENYACTNIKILDPGEKTSVSEFVQYHRFGMRSWIDINGQEHKVMVEHRGKSDSAQIIKLLRKDTKNIHAIDDVAGFKMTFMTKKDIYGFLEKLQSEAKSNGSSFLYEEIYDTIDNGDQFRVTNPGSSNKLEIIKVHLHHNGSLIELQLHTLRSFIDSRLHDEYGFEEYALGRLFQKGKYDESVIDLLYPPDIYGDDIPLYYDELKADIRENKRVRSHFLPKNRSLKELRRVRYSDSDLVADSSKVIAQLTQIPDVVVAVGKSGLPFAREVVMHIPGSRLVLYDPQNEQTVRECDACNNVLIVDDVGDECVNIVAAKQFFPQAKVAVLGKRNKQAADKNVDFFARTVADDEYLSFTWDRGMKEQESQVFALGIVWRRTTSGKMKILFEKTRDGRFKLPGGRVEETDNGIESGFLREVFEEIGISGIVPHALTDSSYKSPRNMIFPKSFARIYEIEIQRLPKFDNRRDSEVMGLVWVDVDSAYEMLSTPEFKEPFTQALEELKLRLAK